MSAEQSAARRALNAEAAHWFNRQRSGEMSVEETRAFQVWMERDSAHRAAFEQMIRIWRDFGDVAEDPAVIKLVEQDTRRFDRQAQARLIGSIAAGALLATVSAWAAMASGVLAEIGLMAPPRAQELRTSVGQRTTVTLRDNSVVTLDTDTILRIRETSRERRIELERGRAYFQVAKDRSRPFIVAGAGRTVRATGTAFDVRVDDRRMQVTLVEGRVHVADSDKHAKEPQTADMRAGWRLDIRDDEPWRVTPVDLARETSWHNGRLAFFNEPLAKAVAEVNRYSERKIVFQGAAPDVAVVGVFRTGDIDGFVRAVELNKLARVASESEDHIELAAR